MPPIFFVGISQGGVPCQTMKRPIKEHGFFACPRGGSTAAKVAIILMALIVLFVCVSLPHRPESDAGRLASELQGSDASLIMNLGHHGAARYIRGEEEVNEFIDSIRLTRSDPCARLVV